MADLVKKINKNLIFLWINIRKKLKKIYFIIKLNNMCCNSFFF